MDGLSNLIGRFELKARVFHAGVLCGETDFRAERHTGHLHLIRRGPLTVTVRNGTATLVEAPSLVLFLRPTPHRFLSGEEEGADVVCAALDLDGGEESPLLLGIPNPLIIALDELSGLETVLNLLFSEALDPQVGTGIALDRLAELLFVYVVRHCIQTGRMQHGVLAGLADPRLARVLGAIHDAPARPWTLEHLAGIGGMSRAGFAAAFKATIGVTPGAYIAALRMALAKRLLRMGKPVKAIASAVGYGNPAAFSRAFRQHAGSGARDWLAHDTAGVGTAVGE